MCDNLLSYHQQESIEENSAIDPAIMLFPVFLVIEELTNNVISSSFQFLEDYPEAVLDSKMMEGLSAKANALIDRSFQSLDE